jgi:hypothetical protein
MRTKQFWITLLVLAMHAVLLAACQPAAVEAVPDDFQVALERGPCFGTCPVYSVTVSADGEVVYDGMQFVPVEGPQTAKLAPDEVTALYQAVEAGGFFNLEDSYTIGATDLATIVTTVTMEGRTKSVSHYGLGCGTDLDNAPQALCDIEALLEAIPAANGWVTPRAAGGY